MLSNSALFFAPNPQIQPENPVIEYFKKFDIDQLATVARATYKETYPSFTEDELDALFGEFFRNKILNDDLPNINSALLAMKQAGKVIGYARLYFDKEAPYLDKLYLMKSHHGQGLGRALLFRCFEICRERGCNQLNLQAYKENIYAIDFYKRQGFNQVGDPVDYVNPASGQVYIGTNIKMQCEDVGKQLELRRFQY